MDSPQKGLSPAPQAVALGAVRSSSGDYLRSLNRASVCSVSYRRLHEIADELEQLEAENAELILTARLPLPSIEDTTPLPQLRIRQADSSEPSLNWLDWCLSIAAVLVIVAVWVFFLRQLAVAACVLAMMMLIGRRRPYCTGRPRNVPFTRRGPGPSASRRADFHREVWR